MDRLKEWKRIAITLSLYEYIIRVTNLLRGPNARYVPRLNNRIFVRGMSCLWLYDKWELYDEIYTILIDFRIALRERKASKWNEVRLLQPFNYVMIRNVIIKNATVKEKSRRFWVVQRSFDLPFLHEKHSHLLKVKRRCLSFLALISTLFSFEFYLWYK